jgi:hypothetical protein
MPNAQSSRAHPSPLLLALMALALTISSLALFASPAAAQDPRELPSLPGFTALPDSLLADRYIVVLKERVGRPGDVAREHATKHGAEVKRVYRTAIKGYAARIPEGRVENVRNDPRVEYVEADRMVRVHVQEIPSGIHRTFATNNANLDIDGSDATRIDADIAILDTGVDGDHPDLNMAGRTDCTFGDLLNEVKPPQEETCLDGAGYDDAGHGTHVAGTAAALDNGTGVVGVAPGARIWSVKVLQNGSGLLSWIIGGIDWVTANAEVIEVANMSLGGRFQSDALDKALANSVAAGVVYTVSAGNSASDAAEFSPARHPDVITVSAMGDYDGKPGGLASPTCIPSWMAEYYKDDHLANFSNWGETVEVTAPGVCTTSTWVGGGYHTISGTSMSSPHVAGAAALLASAKKLTDKAGVEAIRQAILAAGNKDWNDLVLACGFTPLALGTPGSDGGCTFASPDGIQEPLLGVGDAGVFVPLMLAGPFVDNALPVASFSQQCDAKLNCIFDASASANREGGSLSYGWNFGDPGRSGSSRSRGESGALVSHTFTHSGKYLVVLTVTNDKGVVGRNWAVVTVSDGKKGPHLAMPRCGQPGDDKCEDWVAAYDNPNGYNIEGFRGWGIDSDIGGGGLVMSPTGDGIYGTVWSWDNTTESWDAATVARNSAGEQLWVARYNGPAGLDELPGTTAVSPDGRRVYVTGIQDACYVWGGCAGEEDFVAQKIDAFTMAYDAATGERLWNSSWGSPDTFEQIADATVSQDGAHVLITAGSSEYQDYVTISYDAATGTQQWLSRYDGSFFDSPTSIATYGNRVYVTGNSEGAPTTVAYDLATGNELWVARYESEGFHGASEIQMSPDGSRVYLLGFGATGSWPNFMQNLTSVAYDAATGRELWRARYDTDPGHFAIVPRGMAVSATGDRLYVVGADLVGFGATTVHTLAYDADSGKQMWAAKSPNTVPLTGALAVSPNGSHVYVAMNQPSDAGADEYNASDAVTLAYSAATGDLDWVARYNSSPRGIQQNYPGSIVVNPVDGRLFVGGTWYMDRVGQFGFDPLWNWMRVGIVSYDPNGGRGTPNIVAAASVAPVSEPASDGPRPQIDEAAVTELEKFAAQFGAGIPLIHAQAEAAEDMRLVYTDATGTSFVVGGGPQSGEPVVIKAGDKALARLMGFSYVPADQITPSSDDSPAREPAANRGAAGITKFHLTQAVPEPTAPAGVRSISPREVPGLSLSVSGTGAPEVRQPPAMIDKAALRAAVMQHGITALAFAVPDGQAATVRIRVYDPAGRLVRELTDETFDAGAYRVDWDKRDERGAKVAPGVYIAVMEAPGFRSTTKLVVVR